MAVAALVVLLPGTPAGSLVPGTIERVSIADNEAEGDEQSHVGSADYGLPGTPTVGPVVSGDGRFVAFSSEARNLVEEDVNGTVDVFVRDRLAGTTERVSISSSGVEGNFPSDFPAISRDGNHVAWASEAAFDPTVDDDGTFDVYVRDLTDPAAPETVLVSRLNCVPGPPVAFPPGFECNVMPGDQWAPVLSADGRFVAFSSDPPSGTTDPPSQIFVYDRDANANGVFDEAEDITNPAALARVSVIDLCDPADVDPCSPDGGDGDSYDPSISDDGRFIAFTTEASNLTGETIGSTCPTAPSAQDNCEPDVVVVDRLAIGTAGFAPTLVSVREDGGGTGNFGSFEPSISGDGSLVAFTSDATDLLPAGQDSNSFPDVFVRDVSASTTDRVSVTATGGQAGCCSRSPAISADGGFVAFVISPTPLVADDTNGDCDCNAEDIYLHRLSDGHLELVSQDSAGNQAIESSEMPNPLNDAPAVSASGRHVAWESPWPFVPEDGNTTAATLPTGFPGPASDVYLRELPASLLITPDPADFGSVIVGQSSAVVPATVRNVGSVDLSLVDVAVSAGGEFSVVDDSDCFGGVLAAGATCQVTLRFSPAGLGSRLATLSVSGADSAGQPVFASALLRGTGLPVAADPALTVTPDPVDFGVQVVGGLGPVRSALVRSVGGQPVVIPAGGVSVIGTNPSEFPIVTDGCGGQTLAPGATCAVTIAFAPTAPFDRTAVLQVLSNVATSPHGVTLRGAGEYRPTLQVNPAVGKLGEVTTTIGAGYPPGASVLLSWTEGESFVNNTVTVVVDGTGAFQAPIQVLGKDRLGPRHLNGTTFDGWTAQAVFLAELPTASPPSFLVRG